MKSPKSVTLYKYEALFGHTLKYEPLLYINIPVALC